MQGQNLTYGIANELGIEIVTVTGVYSDIAFHVAVLRASRNRFYAQLTGFTATALRFSIQTTKGRAACQHRRSQEGRRCDPGRQVRGGGPGDAQVDPGGAGSHLQT
jgi:hypothetical protein